MENATFSLGQISGQKMRPNFVRVTVHVTVRVTFDPKSSELQIFRLVHCVRVTSHGLSNGRG